MAQTKNEMKEMGEEKSNYWTAGYDKKKEEKSVNKWALCGSGEADNSEWSLKESQSLFGGSRNGIGRMKTYMNK